ncbi:hypothetical protein [Streptomyces sp. RPT161]|uniref:hypothetical protein n=1 Tax=Streptomyces sp. RPT161 TaxID=3015993 RepID=UPI0022B93F48|nr:hypothetical protein [Streptomyces sp. RPT161]
MNWQGHWHGYGPWIGSRDAYGNEGMRRPGRLASDEQTRSFLASDMPPMMNGHWLLRRSQTAADRTWTNPETAVAWLEKTYAENPPFERDDGRRAYTGRETKTEYAMDVLPRGVDVSWVYYLKSASLASFSVVCCPNHFHPEIPCPLPPR